MMAKKQDIVLHCISYCAACFVEQLLSQSTFGTKKNLLRIYKIKTSNYILTYGFFVTQGTFCIICLQIKEKIPLEH